MKVKQCMTRNVISLTEDENAASAARIMARNNVGALPVRGREGRLSGIVTDRDLVLRCMASGQAPEHVPVGSIMTSRLAVCSPEDTVLSAAETMAREQVRRLPVVENGHLVGMMSLADVSRQSDHGMVSSSVLAEISRNVKKR